MRVLWLAIAEWASSNRCCRFQDSSTAVRGGEEAIPARGTASGIGHAASALLRFRTAQCGCGVEGAGGGEREASGVRLADAHANACAGGAECGGGGGGAVK